MKRQVNPVIGPQFAEDVWSTVSTSVKSVVGILKGEVVMSYWMLCRSLSIILGGRWSPVGCHETVLGALVLMPGMWIILNW